MTAAHPAPPVTLKQETSRRDELSAQHFTGKQFLEDMGAAVYGKIDGQNLVLIALAYRVGGSVWGVEDTIINNSTFHVAPFDQKKIENNPFISHRVDPMTRHDDYAIEDDGEKVTWRAGNRQYIARPPFWEIKGEHLGVDCNVTMEQIGSPDWYVGTWEDLPQNGRGGRDVWTKATGSIDARGEVYQLGEKSLAIQEHVLVGEHWVAEAAGSAQYFYHLHRTEEFQIFIYARPDFNVIYSRMVFNEDGREIYFVGRDQVTITPTEHWLDPETFMRPPVQYGIKLQADEATVELTLTAYSRGVYSYSLTDATRTHYSFLVHSSGSYALGDGRRIPIADVYEDVCYAEWGCTNNMGSGVSPALQVQVAP